MASDKALLIIDVQVDMFRESNPVAKGPELLATIKGLIAKARDSGVPVIYVKHSGSKRFLVEGTPGFEIHPEIAPIQGDLIVVKRTPCAFNGTNLKEELDRRGIRNLTITGIQSELCVDTTCRSAYNLGYRVVLVEDGHSTFNTPDLPAEAISRHHNRVLGSWFAEVMKASDAAGQWGA
ncbi:MAG: cysteine hydrolase family protein [Bacillota bacterium]